MNTQYQTHAMQKLKRAYGKLQTENMRENLLAKSERIQEELRCNHNLSASQKTSLDNAQCEIDELLFLNDMVYIQQEFYPIHVNRIELLVQESGEFPYDGVSVTVTKLFDDINQPLDLETMVTKIGCVMSYNDILTNVLQENAAHLLRENIQTIDLYDLLG